MADVVKKHSISSELAQKMVGAAVAKARELGVSENVAILDDGGNLMAFSRMDGAPILSIEMAQNKAYTALFGVSTQDFFIAHFMFPFGRRLPPHPNFAAIFLRMPDPRGASFVCAHEPPPADPHQRKQIRISADKRRLGQLGPWRKMQQIQRRPRRGARVFD
jgi:hypothetical protein